MSTTDVFQMVCTNNGDEVLSLIDSIDITQSNEWGENLLHTAIAYANTPLGEELVRRGIDVNHQNSDKDTPLHYAAEHGNLSLARIILGAGGDVNICDQHGNSPLWTAIHNAREDYSMVELFLKYKADVSHKNNYGRTPIDTARERGHSSLVCLLEASA